MRPKNFLAFFIFFGSGQLSTLFTFFFSISILLGLMTTPRNLIFLTFHIHFSSLTYKLFSYSFFNISFTILLCSFSVSVSTNTLSIKATTFPLLIIFLRILFIIVWNIASEFVILNNITVGSKNSTCVVNVLFYLSSSFIFTLLNLYCKSILVNTLLLPMLFIKFIINSSG